MAVAEVGVAEDDEGLIALSSTMSATQKQKP
jgi:hypothetical protein